MFDDIRFHFDGEGAPATLWGTPEGNRGVERLIDSAQDKRWGEMFRREYPWFPSVERLDAGIYRGTRRQGRYFLDDLLRLTGSRETIEVRRPDVLDGEWIDPSGIADDLEQVFAYVERFKAHPTREFLLFVDEHKRHERQGTGPGMVLAAVAGQPVHCAIRWRKAAQYIGTRFPSDEPPHEYLCDEPFDSFIQFSVIEWVVVAKEATTK